MKPLIALCTIGLSLYLGSAAAFDTSPAEGTIESAVLAADTQPVAAQTAPVAQETSHLVLDTTLGTPQPNPKTVATPLQDTPSVLIATHDLTASEHDLWARIRRGFGMTDLQGSLVDERQQWYLARPEALTTMLGRSSKYLFHIVTELEKRGMPTELALLPIVESAYNPMALSSAKAAGLWQFVPATGRDFKLEQNWWIDERRDVLASTSAALDYLQAIYEMHGDWHLALASYNWGENAVARAISKNLAAGLPTDYSSLTMPQETRYYVPKLQALKNIIAQAPETGVALPVIPNQPYFVTVDKHQGIDVSLAAKLAEMPLADFKALNPSYNRPVIPTRTGTRLVLPVENAQRFKDNLASNDRPLISWRTWSLPKSARIEQIAQRLKVGVAELIHANGLSARARLASGYTLLVPLHADLSISKAKPTVSKTVRKKTVSRKPASAKKPIRPTRLSANPDGKS